MGWRRRTEQTVAQRNTTGMLVAMGALGKHVYAGTVPWHVKEQRRRRNRAARKARRLNR